jgi:hypothetical protein
MCIAMSPQAGWSWSAPIHGLLLPAWGFFCLVLYGLFLAFCGVLLITAKLLDMARTETGRRPPYANSAPGGRDLTTEEQVAVLEIFERKRLIPEDPPLAAPEFEDVETLGAAYRCALFFLDQLELNHLVDLVLLESNYIVFLGARIYVVPSTGSGPDRLFEVWYKRTDEWERHGVFGSEWKSVEHVYINHVRGCVKMLERGSRRS